MKRLYLCVNVCAVITPHQPSPFPAQLHLVCTISSLFPCIPPSSSFSSSQPGIPGLFQQGSPSLATDTTSDLLAHSKQGMQKRWHISAINPMWALLTAVKKTKWGQIELIYLGKYKEYYSPQTCYMLLYGITFNQLFRHYFKALESFLW